MSRDTAQKVSGMTEEDFETTYPTFTRTLKVQGGETLTVRVDSADDLLAALEELDGVSDKLSKIDAKLRASLGSDEKPASARPASTSRPASSGGGGAKKSYTRSSRPGSGGNSRGKREEAPMSEELCDCGEPFKDLNGMRYKTGAKKGELYGARFYRSCENQDCAPWGDQE